MFHGLVLWPGEVLSTYAIVGVIALRLIDAKDATRLLATAGCFAIALMVYGGVGAAMLLSPQPPTPSDTGFPSFAQSSFGAAMLLHLREFVTYGLLQALAPDFWGHVFLGMWAGSSGFLARYVSAPYGYVSVTVVGSILFFGATAVEIFAATRGGWNARTFGGSGQGWGALAHVPAGVAAVWFWLTLSARWGRTDPGPRSLASLVVAAGRAPLTQFMGQSIVFALLFNQSLVGLHGALGRGAYSLVAITTYLLLCAFIRAWLASGHRYGPMEMLWRRLTQAFSPLAAVYSGAIDISQHRFTAAQTVTQTE